MKTDAKKKIEKFFMQFPVHKYNKGEILLNPNEQSQEVIYLKKGFVREYGISFQGIELSLHIFTPFSYFPMTSALTNIPNRYYYEALTETHVHHAQQKDVLLFLSKNPDVLLSLTKRIFLGVDKLLMRIETLTLGSACERVVSTLLYLAGHFGESKAKKIQITNKFTHRDIASLSGVSRETASREIEKLEKKGLISHKNGNIIINNDLALKEELLLGK